MALPGQLKSNRLTGSSQASTTPTKLAELEALLCDVFGFTIDTNITESPIGSDNAGILTKDLLRQKAAGPVGVRFRDSTTSTEYRLVLSGANILIDQNTGTEGTPVWTNRLTIAVATGNITAPGTLALTGTLGVTGAATLSSTLAVTGAITKGGVAVQLQIQKVKIQDQKTSGTDGGTFTTGDWRTRDLNTLVDPKSYGYASVATNQITLAAGDYIVRIEAPVTAGVGAHRLRLRDITNTVDRIYSMTHNATLVASNLVDVAIAEAEPFTLSGSTVLEIQHYCGATKATTGFGIASSLGIPEYYTTVHIYKIG
jgi:hypothetical protein